MSDEKREILGMLSDGKIDVDEAERLLLALEAGAKKRGTHDGTGSSRKQQAVQDALNSVREVLAGVGPMVGRVAGEISTEFQKDRNFPGEMEAEELPLLEHEGDRFPVAEGEKLFIRNDKVDGPGGGDLIVTTTADHLCLYQGDGAKNVRILSSSSGPVIRWSGGLLRVQVPAQVAELFAFTLGGDSELTDLPCPAQVKSMGGDLQLTDLGHRFKAKTMGGNIRLKLPVTGDEASEAKTMGGNIRIEVAEESIGTATEAVTLGGTILVDEELGAIDRGSNLGKKRVRIDLGEGETKASLKVKTMGGNIEIRRCHDE
jgi:hypothetical protein